MSWTIARLILVLAVLVPGSIAARSDAAGEPGTGNRVALVVANGDYKDAPLAGALKDGRAMAARLGELGFDVILRENATRDGLGQAIVDFGKRLGPAKVGLFFYSGIAIQSKRRNYLVPVDAVLDVESELRFKAVELEAVLEEFGQARAGAGLAIVDAGSDNPIERHLRGDAPARGLAAIEPPPKGTLLAFAASPGVAALDAAAGGSGVYANALLRALAQPGLPAVAFFQQVRDDVMQRTKDQQVPWASSSLAIDLVLNAKTAEAAPGATGAGAVSAPGAPTAPGAGASERLDREALFWHSIHDSRNAADFEEYLQRYPQGEFAGLARRRLDELRKPTATELRPETAAGPGAAFWTAIRDSRNPADFEEYLERYPQEASVAAARHRLDELRKAAPAASPAPAAKPEPPAPAAPKAESGLEPIGRDYVAKEAARVREAPDANAKIVATLKAGETIHVAGKVSGADWYRVDRGSQWFGFVASHLLVDAAEYRAQNPETPRQQPAASAPALPSPSTQSARGSPGPTALSADDLAVAERACAAVLPDKCPAVRRGDPAALTDVGIVLMVAKGGGLADYGSAARLLRLAATRGNLDAMAALAGMYLNGRGVQQDNAEAFRLSNMAAERGGAWGQYNLGLIYKLGVGVPRNLGEAARWFGAAAAQNYVAAQSELAVMYYEGIGVAQNQTEALRWFRPAAAAGDATAEMYLGRMYYLGKTVQPNYPEAARLLTSAAGKGNARAETVLALMYLEGKGVPQNLAEAFRLARHAASQNDEAAIEILRRVCAMGFQPAC